MTSITDFLPITPEKESEIRVFLRSQKDLMFVSDLNVNDHINLIVLFLDRPAGIQQGYFQDPSTQLVIQSFVLKLRDPMEQKKGQYRKLLKRFSEPVLLEIVKVSPPTVLNELFKIRIGSVKKTVTPVRILNRYPSVFVSLLLNYMNSGTSLDLASLVLSPSCLKVLAKQLSPDEFLHHFNKDPKEMQPLMECGMYGKGVDPKTLVFSVVADTLILSAATQGTLESLCLNGPSELKSLIPETISCLCTTLGTVPDSLIPFIPELASRFGPAIFSQIRDPRALLHSAYLFMRQNPDQVNVIATLVAERPALWSLFAQFMEDMPALGLAMGKYLPRAFSQSNSAPFSFVEHTPMTTPVAIACLNRLKSSLPESLNAVCSCATCGELSLRLAATMAYQAGFWCEFCKSIAGQARFAHVLFACISDRTVDGDIDGALEMTYDACIHYMTSSSTKSLMSDYVMRELANVQVKTRHTVLTYAKVIMHAHKFSRFVIPMLDGVLDTCDNKTCDLLIRYMWAARDDPNPSFLLYRLKLVWHRCQQGRPPNFWSDEMLQLAADTHSVL